MNDQDLPDFVKHELDLDSDSPDLDFRVRKYNGESLEEFITTFNLKTTVYSNGGVQCYGGSYFRSLRDIWHAAKKEFNISAYDFLKTVVELCHKCSIGVQYCKGIKRYTMRESYGGKVPFYYADNIPYILNNIDTKLEFGQFLNSIK